MKGWALSGGFSRTDVNRGNKEDGVQEQTGLNITKEFY